MIRFLMKFLLLFISFTAGVLFLMYMWGWRVEAILYAIPVLSLLGIIGAGIQYVMSGRQKALALATLIIATVILLWFLTVLAVSGMGQSG
ncbi:hypothetical protein [Sediminibacillus massiliensis]|uniref:hypothetical protein n=1 Tax=Sediminibacillus massiliensis TaxID=1926277 RepID=UPI0009883942|nr:hypothetical protein [Sediminibacillus massiliensis]